MALTLFRGRTSRPAVGPMEIGADGARTMSCPTCARPLAADAPRCPGCGTYLLLGVPAKRAGIFLVSGAVIGLVIGGSLIGSVMAARLAAVAGPVAVASPVAGGGATAVPSSATAAGGVTAGAPATVQAALRQTLAMNGRLAATTAALDVALAARPFDSHAVATTLRTITADAAVGASASATLARWDDAATIAPALSAAYREIRRVARDGLTARLANERAYREAAAAMLVELADLASLDVSIRELAAGAGVDAPAVP